MEETTIYFFGEFLILGDIRKTYLGVKIINEIIDILNMKNWFMLVSF